MVSLLSAHMEMARTMGTSTFYLFAVPNFLSGAASIFDPADALSTYNESPSGEDADAIAAFADWRAVGLDLEQAFQQPEVSLVIKAGSTSAAEKQRSR